MHLGNGTHNNLNGPDHPTPTGKPFMNSTPNRLNSHDRENTTMDLMGGLVSQDKLA